MKVAWVADRSDITGGAELTAQAFKDAAPEGVEFVDAEPDVYCVHNCVQFSPDLIEQIGSTPVVRYVHDLWPHGSPVLRRWLLENSTLIFCGPGQRDWYQRMHGVTGELVPPAMDLEPFRKAASDTRNGVVWVSNMTNHGKGVRQASEWAEVNRTRVKFYGSGPYRPAPSEWVADCGEIPHDKLPRLLGRTERLVFLPTGLEPFGRIVAEAWAAGCAVTTNQLVGAKWFIENDKSALSAATQDFWRIVEEAAG